jgi:hypothetical protein
MAAGSTIVKFNGVPVAKRSISSFLRDMGGADELRYLGLLALLLRNYRCLGCSPEHQCTCFNGTKVQILTHVFELSLAVLRSTNGKVTGFNVVMKVFVNNNVRVRVRPSAYEALSYYCVPPNDGDGVRRGDGRYVC